jgi:hypothetical protein
MYLASNLGPRLLMPVTPQVTVFVSAGHKAAAVPRYRRLLNQCPHDPLLFLLDTDKPALVGARIVEHGRATNTTTCDLNGGLF